MKTRPDGSNFPGSLWPSTCKAHAGAVRPLRGGSSRQLIATRARGCLNNRRQPLAGRRAESFECNHARAGQLCRFPPPVRRIL